MKTILATLFILLTVTGLKAQEVQQRSGLYLWNMGYIKNSRDDVKDEIYYLLHLRPDSTFTLTRTRRSEGGSILFEDKLAAGNYSLKDSHCYLFNRILKKDETVVMKDGYNQVLNLNQMTLTFSQDFETIKILEQDSVLINNTFYKTIFYNDKGNVIARGARNSLGQKHKEWTWFDKDGNTIKRVLYENGTIVKGSSVPKGKK